MKKRKKNDQTLQDVLSQFIKQYDREGKYGEAKVIDAWRTEMGKTINGQTKNLYIKNKKLYVQILSSALKNEIMMNKSKVIRILNDKASERVILDLVIL